MKKRTFVLTTIRPTTAQHRKLKSLARQRGMSMSQLLIQAVLRQAEQSIAR